MSAACWTYASKTTCYTCNLVMELLYFRACRLLRTLRLGNNSLTGSTSTYISAFGLQALDNNCLDNCTYFRQSSCTTVASSEYQALTDLYNSTSGPLWANNRGWLAGDPCQPSMLWFGVQCNYTRVRNECGRSVLSLALANNSLNGSLLSSISGLTQLR